MELKLAEDGEILAKGPNVFGGFKDEEATMGRLHRGRLVQDRRRGPVDGGRLQDSSDRGRSTSSTAGGKNVPLSTSSFRFADDPVFANVVYGDGKKFLVLGVAERRGGGRGGREGRAGTGDEASSWFRRASRR
ncbi:MAG: hypothetical protein R3F14_38800 [Polyangiaceae bacterium]